jgi:hypothetical protein
MSDLVQLKSIDWMQEGYLVFEKTSDFPQISVPESEYPLKISFCPHITGVLMQIGATKTVLNRRAIADLTTRLNSIKLGEAVFQHPKGDKVYFTKIPPGLRITLRNYSFMFDPESMKYLLDALPVMVIAGMPVAMPLHPAINSMVEKLRDREVAAANDLVATEEERNYRPLQVAADEYDRILKQVQEKSAHEATQYQNDLNFAMLTGQTSPDSSVNQARINQGK